MRWSFTLFRVWGINIDLHLTFLFFFMLVFLLGFNQIVFFVVVFSLVLSHELVHSLVAKLSGVAVPRILLLPIGGLASIELPEDPQLELRVSVAGPLFNFFLAGVFAVVLLVFGLEYLGYGAVMASLLDGGVSVLSPQVFVSLVITLNVILGGFNMLPAFPMDGGRAFRSVLAFWTDYLTATRIAVNVGRVLFLFMVFFGFFVLQNLWWVLIGLFLSLAGGSELRMTALRGRIRGLRAGEVCCRSLSYVNGELVFGEFLERVFSPEVRFYLVADSSGGFLGVLDSDSFDLREVDLGERVSDLVFSGFSVVDESSPVESVLRDFLGGGLVLVSRGGRVSGFVSKECLERFLGGNAV